MDGGHDADFEKSDKKIAYWDRYFWVKMSETAERKLSCTLPLRWTGWAHRSSLKRK